MNLLVRQADQRCLIAGDVLVVDDVLDCGDVEGELFHEGLQKIAECIAFCHFVWHNEVVEGAGYV